MAVHIGDLAGAAMRRVERRAQRTYPPVRRGSREKGTFEAQWRRPAPPLDTMMRAVRAVDQHEHRRNPGAPAGPFGDAGQRIIAALTGASERLTGELSYSLRWLCRAANVCRATAVKYIARFEAFGFLDRQRRYQRTDVAPGEIGPRWKQATNVYRLTIPDLARRLLGLRGDPPALPACETQRRAEQSAASRAMEDALPPAELIALIVTDPGLAAALASLASSRAEQWAQTASLATEHHSTTIS